MAMWHLLRRRWTRFGVMYGAIQVSSRPQLTNRGPASALLSCLMHFLVRFCGFSSLTAMLPTRTGYPVSPQERQLQIGTERPNP